MTAMFVECGTKRNGYLSCSLHQQKAVNGEFHHDHCICCRCVVVHPWVPGHGGIVMVVGVLKIALRLIGALMPCARRPAPCSMEPSGSSSEEYLGAEAIVPTEAMRYLAANSRSAHPPPFFSRLRTR